ncbi:hypothetical protein DH2020_021104 [Rehmannia glutinosa]|uniref:Uncharacterized protein n=1 Tax=Rehmannia glutinosa TaxID=99300 RepID=A0ABR0WD93_REHGL
MKVKIGSSKLVKPFYEGNPPLTTDYMPLSVFDKVTYDQHVAVIYAYRPPTPPNAMIELGLRKALAVYREWAGRLGKDSSGEPIILLNDEGVRFVEASVDRALDETVTFVPSASLTSLHPNLEGVVEPVQVQIHEILVWLNGGGLHGPPPSDRRTRDKASAINGTNKPFSTFESLVAHLWRAITKARCLNGLETTQVRVSVDGRARLNPRVPNEYFGNLVLWAFAKAKVDDLLREPLPYAAKLLHEAVMNVNDKYFKSFIDFANHKVRQEDLVPNAVADTKESILWPNLEVDSWLRFPFYDLDFGGGGPYIFMPSFSPTEGMIFLLPSFIGDGSIDVFVPLFREKFDNFQTDLLFSRLECTSKIDLCLKKLHFGA